MKGTDFVTHAIRKCPGLSESDFILLTHRLDAVPTRNYGFPVIEKPLRAPQIRQAVLQKIKQAQEITEAQARAANKPAETETAVTEPNAPRKGKTCQENPQHKARGEEERHPQKGQAKIGRYFRA